MNIPGLSEHTDSTHSLEEDVVAAHVYNEGLAQWLPKRLARGPLTEQETTEIAVYSGMVATILKSAQNELRVRDELLETSRVDPVTGLYKREAIEHRVLPALEATMTPEEEATWVVFVIDVNNFKTINDLYGHAVGDKALRSIGDGIYDALREEDIAVRMGGDEMAVFARVDNPRTLEGKENIDVETVPLGIVDRIIASVRTNYFEADGDIQAVNASVGFARITSPTIKAVEDALNQADSRMYHDKQQQKRN